MFPIESDIYAVAVHRVWWAPWRWNLYVYRWKHDPFIVSDEEPVAANITKAECIGLIKILGYPHEIKP